MSYYYYILHSLWLFSHGWMSTRPNPSFHRLWGCVDVTYTVLQFAVRNPMYERSYVSITSSYPTGKLVSSVKYQSGDDTFSVKSLGTLLQSIRH